MTCTSSDTSYEVFSIFQKEWKNLEWLEWRIIACSRLSGVGDERKRARKRRGRSYNKMSPKNFKNSLGCLMLTSALNFRPSNLRQIWTLSSAFLLLLLFYFIFFAKNPLRDSSPKLLTQNYIVWLSLYHGKIDNFTVVCLVTWPLNGNEAWFNKDLTAFVVYT